MIRPTKPLSIPQMYFNENFKEISNKNKIAGPTEIKCIIFEMMKTISEEDKQIYRNIWLEEYKKYTKELEEYCTMLEKRLAKDVDMV